MSQRDDIDAAESIEVYDHQRHRNGDETALVLCEFGGGYQALAMDVDAGGQLLELEEIGDAQDRETAVGMCEYWLQQNPEGILGADPDADGGGILAKLGIGGGAG